MLLPHVYHRPCLHKGFCNHIVGTTDRLCTRDSATTWSGWIGAWIGRGLGVDWRGLAWIGLPCGCCGHGETMENVGRGPSRPLYCDGRTYALYNIKEGKQGLFVLVGGVGTPRRSPSLSRILGRACCLACSKKFHTFFLSLAETGGEKKLELFSA